MPEYTGFPVLLDSQVKVNHEAAVFQPGAIFIHKSGTGRAQTSWVQYVQLGNNGCNKGAALMYNPATLNTYSVKKSSLTWGYAPNFVGIAAGTIASQRYGFMVIGGYCEYAYISETAVAGENLCVSGTTEGQLTANRASSVYSATCVLNASYGRVIPVAIARGACTGGDLGSITLCGIWGV
jgi:hypothetical protein